MSMLYLSKQLSGWSDLTKAASQTSEVRGGDYAARVQEGYEKDGSPKYRYFKTQEEYEKYLQGKGKGKKKKKKKDSDNTLAEKREEERKDSKKKQSKIFAENKKKKKEVETTKKSLSLYLRVDS